MAVPTKPRIPKAEYQAIRKMRDSGMTLQRIAELYGVSRQRIHAIINDRKAS